MRRMITARWFVPAAVLLFVSTATAQDWPLANAGGNYTVMEGDWVMLDASGSSGMNGTAPQTYLWDLDNNGVFESTGYGVWFNASWRDGAESQIVSLQVCVSNACDTDMATINILNAPPEVDAGSDVTLYSGETFSLSGFFGDPGTSDLHTALVDYADNLGTVSAEIWEDSGAGIVAGEHLYYAPGAHNVRVCVTDDDGATGCDSLRV